MLTLFLSVISNSSGLVLDKYLLVKKRFNQVALLIYTFIFLALFSFLALFIVPENQKFSFTIYDIVLLFSIAVVALIWHLWHINALKKESLEEYESAIIFAPLFTSLLAYILIVSERDNRIFISAIIASLAYIFSHLKKHHLSFEKNKILLFGAVALISLEAVLVKIALGSFSPVFLYFVRTFIIALLFAIFYKNNLASNAKKIDKTIFFSILLSGLLGVVHKITQFIGFEKYGLVYTVLVLTLSPFFVLFINKITLKEKLHWKNIVSIIIIIGAIIYATI